MYYKLIRILLVLLVFAVCCCCAAVTSAKQVQVTIQNGPIIGESITADGRELSRFLGIRYGQAPVGKLRFRRALTVGKWTEPIRALNWPNGCVQFDQHPLAAAVAQYVTNHTLSEDCLFLNVWSPNVAEREEDKLRPVIVWIYGGGLAFGTSSFDIYDGETLSARADALVVSINYRVGALGFFYSDKVEDVRGNQGLWDQALALEWIQENIRYFGGNPKQVTIMGESAGSWSVSLQILSPVSANLYQNAIMMSGAALNGRAVVQPEQYVPLILKGIRKTGCATEQDQSISKKVVECLEGLDAAVVDQILYLSVDHPMELMPLVVVDGQFLPAKPLDLFAQGNYKTDVNLLASTVEDEGSFFLAKLLPQFRAEGAEPIDLNQAKELLLGLGTSFVRKPVPTELVTKLYFSGLNNQLDSQDAFRKRTAIGFGDVLLGCPTFEFAKAVFRNAPKTASVYQWYYKAKLGRLKMICNQWGGTCHCDDLYPAFGIPFRKADTHLDRERDISNEVISFIKSFIRTGKPATEQSEWLPYFLTDDGQDVVAPYYEINNDYKRAENFKFNLKQLKCSLIWNKYN